MSRPFEDDDVGVVEKTRTERKIARPPLYKVVLHNDDYTTREFVVWVLQTVFRKSESDAVAIMLNVHRTGMGIAGIYPHDVAETKVTKVEILAREHEYPLLCTMEPE